jgi:hypothetical protein
VRTLKQYKRKKEREREREMGRMRSKWALSVYICSFAVIPLTPMAVGSGQRNGIGGIASSSSSTRGLEKTVRRGERERSGRSESSERCRESMGRGSRGREREREKFWEEKDRE